MDTLARKKIRIFYYTSCIIAMAVVSLAVAIPYFVSARNNFKLLINEIENTIMSEKRRNIYNIVNMAIIEIDAVRHFTQIEFMRLCAEQSLFLSKLDKKTIKTISSNEERIGKRLAGGELGWFGLGIVLYDRMSQSVIWSNGNEQSDVFVKLLRAGENDSERFPAVSHADSDWNTTVYAFASKESLDHSSKERSKHIIRNILFDSNRYIWVNEVLNFDGGDDYAIRTIHPNLPATEGSRLSTNTQDIKGNFPYKTELEGVKTQGDVYFNYYFKKMNSEEVTEKLTYAKLYKPYNWIVATGVHLDEVSAIVQQRRLALNTAYYGQIKNYSLLILSVFAIYIAMLVVFEGKIDRIIVAYSEKLKENEKALRNEKNKLAEAYGQLQDIAYIDYLTGVLNRRAMLEKIKEETSRCKRPDTRFCLILADVDRFKCINDTYGHDVGDTVLKRVAQCLMKSIRTEDAVARWGGEEFLILATSMDVAQGVALAEKLRKTIERLQILAGKNLVQVTMTFGVVGYAEGKAFDDLIKEVDMYLYAGKQKGRNCVSFGVLV